MKQSNVDATEPSVVSLCTSPPLYSTRLATYISPVMRMTVLSYSFNFKMHNCRYEVLSNPVLTTRRLLTFFSVLNDGRDNRLGLSMVL